jgi:hypothetical protein
MIDFIHFSIGFFIGGGVGTLVGLALYGLHKSFYKK